MQTIYHTDLSNPNVIQQLVVAAFVNKEVRTQTLPGKNVPLAFVDGSIILEDSNSISFHLADGSKLVGMEFEEEAEIYSWVQYFNLQVVPLLNELYGQIFGSLAPHKNKFNYALEELRKAIKVIDEQLKMRSFLVADRITLADVIICCQMDKAFRLIITSDMRKKLPNLTRWFSYIRQTQPFVSKIGQLFLCQAKGFEPVFEEEKPKQEPVVAEKKQQQPSKQPQTKVQQQGSYSIDGFKRAYQNAQNKEEPINELLNDFPAGWSIWKIHYIKDVTEGKIDYVTANMCRGTIQRLEQLRKIGFGMLGVYQNEENKDYQIRGVMFWKGEGIAKNWEEQGSYEYHNFTKLNPKEEGDRKIVKDYWLFNEKAEGLSLYTYQKLI